MSNVGIGGSMLKWLKKLAVGLGLVAAMPTASVAVNGTTYDSLSVFKTQHNIMLRVYYSGDDDSDMVVQGRVKLVSAGSLPATDSLLWFRSWKLGNGQADGIMFGRDN